MYKQMLSSAYTAVMKDTDIVNTINTVGEPEISISDPEHTVVDVPDNIETKRSLDVRMSNLKSQLDGIIEIKKYISKFGVNRTLISMIGQHKLAELFDAPIPSCENLGPHTQLPKLTERCLNSSIPSLIISSNFSDLIHDTNKFYSKLFNDLKNIIESNNVALNNCHKKKLSKMYSSSAHSINSISEKTLFNIKRIVTALESLSNESDEVTVKNVMKHPFVRALFSPNCVDFRMSYEYITNDKKVLDKYIQRIEDTSEKTLLAACESWNTKLSSFLFDIVDNISSAKTDNELKTEIENAEAIMSLRDRLMEVAITCESARSDVLRQYRHILSDFYRK